MVLQAYLGKEVSQTYQVWSELALAKKRGGQLGARTDSKLPTLTTGVRPIHSSFEEKASGIVAGSPAQLKLGADLYPLRLTSWE